MSLSKAEMIALGAVGIVVALVLKNGKAVGETIGSGAVDLVNGVVTGGVVSIGETVGIPATNVDQCAADRAAGKTWAASFSCPAKTFLKYLFGSKTA